MSPAKKGKGGKATTKTKGASSDMAREYPQVALFCHHPDFVEKPLSYVSTADILQRSEVISASLESNVLWEDKVRVMQHELQFDNEPKMMFSLFWKISASVSTKALAYDFIPEANRRYAGFLKQLNEAGVADAAEMAYYKLLRLYPRGSVQGGFKPYCSEVGRLEEVGVASKQPHETTDEEANAGARKVISA